MLAGPITSALPNGRPSVSSVRRYHRTLATLLNGLIEAGLVIERVIEPAPSETWIRDRPRDADECRRPMFLLVRARKA